ncbi:MULTISPECIES: hypothetical protein [Micrococcales]|uniref:hypothetical protein n=1 Tax=Micrococcales TaxID=85006 RepID=UPI0004AA112F|nr:MULTISPECIES: hypothetical protein [Micrococcales]
MLNTVILASATVAKESEGYDLGIPHWLVAVIFFCAFVLLAIVTMSFSGRGIQRDSVSPSSLSPEEVEAMTEYSQKHRR